MRPTVFILKVALQGAKRIWRRIAVRGDQTLDDLHEAIFEAFDRDDEHLYSFYFPMPGTRGRARLRNAVEFSCPFNCKDPGPFADEPLRKAAKARLADLELKRGTAFLYLFDFGDAWWHEITVEQADTPADEGQYPRILERNGESPPQYPDPDSDGNG